MGKAGMVGQFIYKSLVSEDAILVNMAWQGTQRVARIDMPPALRQAMEDIEYPMVEGEFLRLESALSYGVFIAMQAGLDLMLSGDRTVWDPAWGTLHFQDTAAVPNAEWVNH